MSIDPAKFTIEDFHALRTRGAKVLQKIIPLLNSISEQFIHTKQREPEGTYRRSEDCDEICIALALWDIESQSEGSVSDNTLDALIKYRNSLMRRESRFIPDKESEVLDSSALIPIRIDPSVKGDRWWLESADGPIYVRQYVCPYCNVAHSFKIGPLVVGVNCVSCGKYFAIRNPDPAK